MASSAEGTDLSAITRDHVGLEETLASFDGNGFKDITPRKLAPEIT